MTIEFENIPASIRKPGKYFEFNNKLAVRTLPANAQKVLILGQRLVAHIEPARFQGGTLNDADSAGTFIGVVKADFLVKISTADATDKFQFSTDNGQNWSVETAVTGAAQALEDGVTITFAATTGHAVDDQWNLSAWPEPTVAEAIPTEIFAEDEASKYFGHGSLAHLMAIAAIKANPYIGLTVCALNDAGASTASAGSIKIGGPANTPGSIVVYIGNDRTEVGISKDDTAAEIATALQTELAKKVHLPVYVALDKADATKIDFTAKNKGTVGSQIGLTTTITATGVTSTIVAMTGGATDPDVTTALTAVFAEQYDIIASAYNDQTSITAVRDHLDTVSGPIEQRPGVSFYGNNGTLASATTLAGNINHERVNAVFLRSTKSTPYELACAFAAVRAREEDPARPLNGLELKGIHAPAIADRLDRNEQESCLANGVTPIEIGPGETVQIVRFITTYIKDGQGIDDISYLDGTTISTLDYVRKACRERVSLRFPREKLSSKTAPKVRSELLDVLLRLEQLEIVEEVEANKDGLTVVKSGQDPNRLDAKIPVDVVNGLHILAGRIDLLL